jgi:hypothetical protein
MKLTVIAFCLAVTAGPSLETSLNRSAAWIDGPRTGHFKTGSVIVLPQKSRDPDTEWREIKSLVEADLSSGSSPVGAPAFTVTKIGKTSQLTIKKGNVGDIGFGDDPYGAPFRKQMLLELLRRALTTARLDAVVTPALPEMGKKDQNSGRADGGAQWQCFLDQAELLVRQMVVAIQSVSNKDELKQLLQKTEDRIDDLLYNDLFESIEEYARLHKLNIILDRGTDAPKPFSVVVSTSPGGARIWLLRPLRYRQLSKLGSAGPAQWPWEELVQNPALLFGRYRYKARWPNGQFTE